MIFNRNLTAMLSPWLGLVLAALILTDCAAADDSHSPEQSAKLEYFETQVRPLLVEHCYACHSSTASKLKAGLHLDSRDGALQGGDSGPALVPGDASASLLMEAVRYESYEMPPKGKLSENEINVLERWIRDGAFWPTEDGPRADVPLAVFDLEKRKTQHWVWQPIRCPDIPEVSRRSWPRQDLDNFILARLESEQLQPAADIDRAGLLRRLYFDLIGLPPRPEEVVEFLADETPQATQRVVDRLLDSPHFGERWGRHWLDLVRYAESRGHEFDNDAPNAFQYRDYVIRALNSDVSYDQFLREHIAGDLLDPPRLHSEKGFNESILGTGFWFLGEWVHSPVDIRKDEADRFDNMIDVMSKTFLGVTVSCARCHDHKFDAISSEDYYALCGFLQSSDYRQVRFESLEHNARVAEQLAQLDEKQRTAIRKRLDRCGVSLTEVPPLESHLADYLVLDYASIADGEFMQDGFLFGAAPRPWGQPFLAMENGQAVIRFQDLPGAVSDHFWDGLDSVFEKGVQNRSKLMQLPRSGRTLRTPTFALADGRIACRIRGAGNVVAVVDSHRLVAGPLHGETIRPFQLEDRWVTLDLNRYVGHRIHLEFTPDPDSELVVSYVTQGATPEIQRELDERESQIATAVEGFAHAASKCLSPGLAARWHQQRQELQAQVQHRSALAMAMWDGTGEDDHVLIRGNASHPGKVAPRRFLSAIAGESPLDIPKGSGRLQLAEAINAADNPLTRRVIVNRIWHHLMGRGIVPTTDDFGVLGQRPTHPELLDFLATRFLAQGQSLKSFIRELVLSRTYQMSSQSDSHADAVDPNNLLWHHRPPKRLEGEVIRDALLAVSGRLDPAQFGEPIAIHLTAFMDGRGKPGQSGPLDGGNRRSIYVAVRRNFISPFMLAFDTPVPFSTMGRRNSSNVPAQALILMNDPFVLGQAQAWAERVLRSPASNEERISEMYRTAFARLPTEQEQLVASEFIGGHREDVALWRDYAHALINTKEFIFLR